MQWQKPEMREVSLAMEVTAYVNVDEPTKNPAVRAEQHDDSESLVLHATA